MPVMDGMLFVSELRENPETSGIPVVLVTAIDLTGVLPRARELGIKHLLAKPWELESLDLMLNQALIPTDKEWEIPAL